MPKGSREGSYGAYQYVSKPGEFTLQAPEEPGDYEVRVLGAQAPYPTLAHRAIRLENVAAGLEAPAQIAAGAKFNVRWTGPNNRRDYVGIGEKDRVYITYKYTNTGNPVELVAPDKAGDYELRYFLGNGDKVIASRRITAGGVTASVAAPAKVAAGAKFAVTWKGPNNAKDFITLVKVGAPDKSYERYQYAANGNPVELRAPDQDSRS